MTLAASAEQAVERQAADIVERAAAGTISGTFKVTHLGPRFVSTVATFVTSSPAAERAWVRFTSAAFDFERRRTLASFAILEKEATQLEKLIGKAGLENQEAAALRKELQNHRNALKKLEESGEKLAEKAGSEGRRAASRRAGEAAAASEDLRPTRVHLAFLDMVAALSHSAAGATEADAAFRLAYRKFSSVVGVDLEGGWKAAIDSMLKDADAVKAYRKEIERLEQVIAKEAIPEKLEHLTTKALPSERLSGVHSKLKGLLGELFTERWDDWTLIKSSYKEIADRLAAKLGSDWKAVAVRGGMKLDGKETWDEAILLLNTSRGEAKLFLGAQVKTALAPTSLNQTLNDLAREAAQNELSIAVAKGPPQYYRLTQLPPGETSFRWVVNARGGKYPQAEIANLMANGVKVEQITLPMSVDEFNFLADRLLKACAAILNK